MTSSHSVLVGRSPLATAGLGSMVGYGAFSTVYHVDGEFDQVAKISRYGVKASIEREAAVLTALKKDASVGISQLVEYKKLSITIGGINTPLPALILKPRGISAEMHLAQSVDKDKALCSIGVDMIAALDFIHQQRYTHNDVSPKNILFSKQ
jgi:serine/threonine protein kinase